MLSRELKQGDMTVYDWVVRDTFSYNLSNEESDVKGEGRTASNARTNLSLSHHVTPLQWLLLQPESQVLLLALQTSKICPSPPCLWPHAPSDPPHWWPQMQTSYSGLGTGCFFWGKSLLSSTFRATTLTFFRFCSNAIFSVMSTLTFLLKIATCSHCWYLQVA